MSEHGSLSGVRRDAPTETSLVEVNCQEQIVCPVRQATGSLDGVEGSIVGHRPIDPGEDDELISRRLREVTVRPAVGADERCRWDALMGAHHYEVCAT